MNRDELPLDRQLRLEILYARERIYRFAPATPLERLELPGSSAEIWVKREDLSPVKAYKWRGAANRMATLPPEAAALGVVTASAGNHAQGVALVARGLGIRACIYMPRSTPQVKQSAVRMHGGEWVEIRLSGDSYDEAVAAAREHERSTGALYVHAYDDLKVMAGQGTLADEVVLSGKGPFDVAYLQVGGGGMAAGASVWLRTYWPDIELVGVEGVGQASMKAALEAGEPVTLQELDLYCDGTAVRKAGQLPFEVCRSTLDRMVTVGNAGVNRAIRVLWEGLRCISEPSGAMGLAALLQEAPRWEGKKVLLVISGANMDFLQLGLVAQSEGSSRQVSRTIRVGISEKAGSMYELIDRCFHQINVVDFQYGKQDDTRAWPVFTVEADTEDDLDRLAGVLEEEGYEWSDVTAEPDVSFRAIPFRGNLLRYPVFLKLNFYERPGALRDFLRTLVEKRASVGYFNYRQSGERIGRALIGLEFPTEAERDQFRLDLPAKGEGYQSCEVLESGVVARLIGDMA